MSSVLRVSNRRLTACLAIALLLAPVVASIAVASTAHVAAAQRPSARSASSLRAAFLQLAAVRSGALSALARCAEATELPDDRDLPAAYLVSVRVVRVGQSCPLDRPLPPSRGGLPQTLRI